MSIFLFPHATYTRRILHTFYIKSLAYRVGDIIFIQLVRSHKNAYRTLHFWGSNQLILFEASTVETAVPKKGIFQGFLDTIGQINRLLHYYWPRFKRRYDCLGARTHQNINYVDCVCALQNVIYALKRVCSYAPEKNEKIYFIHLRVFIRFCESFNV